MAKTFKHLYPQVCAYENLYLAYRAARKNGKRKKANVAAFECDLEMELHRLQQELTEKTYQPGRYRHFYIYERKRRKISAAPFRDRVVHHALCNVIEPIFEARFIHDSYACRVGKGTHRAIGRAQQFARQHPYALQCDIAQFFPSIDHAILRGCLARFLADDDVLWLIDRILASGVGVLADEYTMRYADDFVLFGDDKSQLHGWRAGIVAFLKTLRLQLHEDRASVFATRGGFTFLGFRLFPHYRRLRKDNARAFGRRLREMSAAYAAGEVTPEQNRERITSWIAHASFGNTYQLRRRIFRAVTFEHPPPPLSLRGVVCRSNPQRPNWTLRLCRDRSQ